MPLQILSSPSAAGDTARELEAAIRGAFPDAAEVTVAPLSPGHFEIRVVDATFEGLSRLKQQQAVYAAIAPFMKGDAAPVHAVDRLETAVPH